MRLRRVLGGDPSTASGLPPEPTASGNPGRDAISRVERALRSDAVLRDGDVKQTMDFYLASRVRRVNEHYRNGGRAGVLAATSETQPKPRD